MKSIKRVTAFMLAFAMLFSFSKSCPGLDSALKAAYNAGYSYGQTIKVIR